MNKTYFVRMFKLKEGAVNLAFNQIYDMAKPRVTSMLKSHFPFLDMSDIDEYYNIAMMDVYNKLERDNIREGTTLSDFIYVIAHNKAVDSIRKNRKMRDLIVEKDISTADVWRNTKNEEYKEVDYDLKDAVAEIVSQLEWPCDTLIPSRYYESMKWAIVAKKSGYSSEKSVLSGHKTCLRKIKNVLVKKYRHLCDFL